MTKNNEIIWYNIITLRGSHEENPFDRNGVIVATGTMALTPEKLFEQALSLVVSPSGCVTKSVDNHASYIFEWRWSGIHDGDIRVIVSARKTDSKLIGNVVWSHPHQVVIVHVVKHGQQVLYFNDLETSLQIEHAKSMTNLANLMSELDLGKARIP